MPKRRRRTPSDDLVDAFKAQVFGAIDTGQPVEGFGTPGDSKIKPKARVSPETKKRFMKALRG